MRLSIVVTVFNRATLVRRTLHSVLTQPFADFEVIVVDDGSTDGTAESVEAFGDPRVKLVRHSRNEGVCWSRNSGLRAASSDWVLMLDSDDELAPGAIATVVRRTSEVTGDIGGLRFMCREDDGSLSPEPPLGTTTWDFDGYVRWAAACNVARTDSPLCVRRSTFERVQYPTDKSMERAYHLRFAKTFRVATFPDVVIHVHSDAPDRLTKGRPEWLLRNAPHRLREFQKVLEEYGADFQRIAPSWYDAHLNDLAKLNFLSAKRWDGLCAAGKYLRRHPANVKFWTATVLGLISPKAIAWAQSWNRRR